VRHQAVEGFGGVVELLAAQVRERCELRLGSVVTELRWEPGSVEVHVRSPAGGALEPLRARCALITLPLGVLQAPDGAPGAVRILPDPGKRDALTRLEMGSVVKVVLRFRTPFWERSPGLAEALRSGEREVKFLLDDGVFPTWWTASPLVGPLLVAWAGGSRARQLIRAAADPTAAAVSALARLLGRATTDVASQLDAAHWHDWERDPFARGAYSYGAPGAGDASEQLAAPVADTLFFAGEAAAGAGRTATVDAALESGHRAAGEILRILSRD